ncbi:MAG: hypothetical protein MJ236_07165 [Clostridia bacterium]|nr:hypothetical protein [Clostridia bacterium]
MKKIIAIILIIVSTILVGVSFGLGSLPMSFAYEKIGTDEALTTQMGNYYEMTWIKGQGSLAPLALVLFFALCVGALVITVTMFMNSKKWIIPNACAALLVLAAGVMIFFLPSFYLSAHPAAPETFKYVLGGGAISMGVLLLVAGVFQVLKTVLIVKED